ncbi:hypothetical protein V8G54_000611 [Vigna mungo]|uniref:Uncharacterized protein n=1 Tax=Vigna mungo TaxID=3915 RepID=A0AAQ3S945_VIGMU
MKKTELHLLLHLTNSILFLLSVSSASSSIVAFLLLPSISSSSSPSPISIQPCFIAHSSPTIRFFIFVLINRLLQNLSNAHPLPTIQVAGKQSCPSILFFKMLFSSYHFIPSFIFYFF